jgi:hypothetical protein
MSTGCTINDITDITGQQLADFLAEHGGRERDSHSKAYWWICKQDAYDLGEDDYRNPFRDLCERCIGTRGGIFSSDDRGCISLSSLLINRADPHAFDNWRGYDGWEHPLKQDILDLIAWLSDRPFHLFILTLH